MITLKLLVENSPINIEYPSVESILSDIALPTLFDAGLVSKCEVYVGQERVAGIPVMKWDRLKDTVVSNATALMRKINYEGGRCQ